MKRSFPLVVLLVCALLAGTSLTCQNIVRSLNDLEPGDDEFNYFKLHPVASDYPPPPDSTLIVFGTVYVNGRTQEGVVCSLFYASNIRICSTDEKGAYGFWCQACYVGEYTIKACFQGRCNRKVDCNGTEYHFEWAASMDPVLMNLCIGQGGPCPFPKCY